MARLSIHGVSLTFGGEALLDRISLHLEPGERCCLVGRNGTGKSTLLKVIAGTVTPDTGEVALSGSAAYLSQEFPQGLTGTAIDVASGELFLPGELERPLDGEESAARSLEARRLLTLLGVEEELTVAEASGGELRRVLLARVLSLKPEILLLDEPTNHLDLETILWLENELLRLSGVEKRSLLFVTHDRAFAQRLATRVAEVDRGTLYSYECGYDEFLSRQEERLENEEARRRRFDQRLAEEEAWLAKGVKARRRRNEGRLRRLLAMRDEQRRRRERIGAARLALDSAGRSGEIVAELEGVTFGYGGDAPPLIRGLSTTVMRGDRIGIVGPNGSGKTTLLRLLLGELEPTEGQLTIGAGLEVTYFDQMRRAIDPDSTVYENVGGGYDTVGRGARQRHIYAYLKDFLFEEADSTKRASSLSGGELNRLMLAKLFTLPSNLLVLDEPTNDLDIDTLELLEELLLDFDGTILLVSHDRRFLDNVVTGCLVLRGGGVVEQSVGTYTDWLHRQEAAAGDGNSSRGSGSAGGGGTGRGSAGGGSTVGRSAPGAGKRGKPKAARGENATNRLSFREARELEGLPERIGELEERLERLHELLADPELYRRGEIEGSTPAELTAEQERLQGEIETAYQRWELLEGKAPS